MDEKIDNLHHSCGVTYLMVFPVLNLIQLGICLFCLIFLPSLFLSLKALIDP